MSFLSKISSLIFFKKNNSSSKQFDPIQNSDRNEGRERKNIPLNDGMERSSWMKKEKRSEELDRRISNASLFIRLLLLRRHFFLSSIRGNDIYIRLRELCLRAYISRNWPVNPVKRFQRRLFPSPSFVESPFDSKVRNFEPTNRSTLLIFRNRVVNTRR